MDRGRSADGNADGRRCALSCDCPRGTLSGEGRRGLLKDKWSAFFFYAGSYITVPSLLFTC